MVKKIENEKDAESLWYGRRVKIVDGSSVSMPDTPENQQAYPQPSRQKKGCGFPIMRITALFSLASGAMLVIAKGNLHVSERALFRRLWKHLKPKDVILGDRGFCGFAEFYLLLQRGVDCVMRNHQRRTKGITEIKRLGKDDRLIEWHKTAVAPKWFSKKRWIAIPERLLVREIRVHVEIKGFRTKNLILVTTLTDPKAFPKEAFAIESAHIHHIPCERLSFKGAISTIRQWAPTLALPALSPSKRSDLYARMLFYIAKDQLSHRPNRLEPRAIKRRPSGYQFLMQPRHLFKEIPHRRKYKKA